jgi:outer membrane protein
MPQTPELAPVLKRLLGDNQMTKLKVAALSTAVAAAMISAPALAAHEAGDMMLRVGAAGVYPTGDSENISGLPAGSKVEADSAWSLGLSFTYMFTDEIGVGVLGAYPFEHDIKGQGSISSLDKVGSTKHLPPTVTLQYYFNNDTAFTPFLGAGVNYTHFFDEDTSGALSGANLNIDDSWGYALEGGVDYDVNDQWMISGQVYYINIEPKADVSTLPGNFKVDINPWVYFVSAGYKF